ncbi:MAG: carboxy terminal-processing peptidase [Planctomycetia bacterium]|nr:carboxy terminal-processing peptidase [Planctomycetia bacterium]
MKASSIAAGGIGRVRGRTEGGQGRRLRGLGRFHSVCLVTSVCLMAGAVCGSGVRAEEPPTAVAGLAAATSPAAAKPGPNDRQITLAVRSYLEREHFTRRPIDDEIARRWFGIFLESLDPMKIYFLQSDIDAFMQKRDSLDDLVKRGDVSFAYEVYNRFLERIDARLPLIERLLATPQDFSKQESIIIDRDDTKWATSEAEAEDNWRKRIKYDLLVQKMEKTPPEEAQDKLQRRYRSFAKRMHQMTADELLETYLSSLTSSLDPHTSFMSPGTLENFEIGMRLQLDGIGASLKGEDGYTTVAELVPGGAADKDGRLQKKDRVVGVGQGTEGDIVDVVDTNLNEVVKLIRGKRGTVVRLKVIPVGQTAPKIYDITRAKIELKDSEARGEVIEEGRKPDGTPFRIGVINLPSFYMDMAGARQGQAEYKSSTRDCKRLLDEFRQKGVDCVVLDLRNNGGGSLPESISLTGLFIDTGPVVQIKDADKRVQQYDDVDPGISWDGPLVVLTNKFSASASEIVAGAIQDYHRGLVVGDNATHGKGTVQSLLDLGRQLFQRLPNAPSLGAIKITMQQFYRPSGLSTQLEGVKSDVELPSITTHLPVGESDLDHAIAFDKVPAATFQSSGKVNDDMLKSLRDRSVGRIKGNEEFGKVEKDIAQYQKRKSEKTISLLESEFSRQWNEGKAAEDEEKKLEESADPKRPIVKRDFYFKEAMNVTVDYLNMLAGGAAGLARTTAPAETQRLQPVPAR